MKKVLFFSLIIFAMFAFGQDIKMKKGIITVDGKEWAKYDGCGTFKPECSIFKGKNEIALVTNEVNDPALPAPYTGTTNFSWSVVKFLGLNLVYEVEETDKTIIKQLYKAGVFDEDGNFVQEKIDRLIEKYGTLYSNKYYKNNNGQTVIINNNTTSERPRNGVSISIGR